MASGPGPNNPTANTHTPAERCLRVASSRAACTQTQVIASKATARSQLS